MNRDHNAHPSPEETAEQGTTTTTGGVLRALTSWVTSGLFHMALMIVAALVTLQSTESLEAVIVAAVQPEEEELLDPEELPVIDDVVLPTEALKSEMASLEPPPDVPAAPVVGEPTEPVVAPPGNDGTIDPIIPKNIKEGIICWFPDKGQGPYGNRDKTGRDAINARWDPNHMGDRAVQAALAWLAAHQLPDGGWSFDHRGGVCQGRCRDHGALAESRIGATAIAILPFLGYGDTHKKGKYRAVITRGLQFLLRKMKQNGSLHEPGGTMYSHGLAAMALCEAYGMTRDAKLEQAAQNSLNFIAEAQDRVGGGWRYRPGQAGDTSVVGWQLMAMKSGHMAYLIVNPQTVRRAERFLDSVESESGAYYGYTAPGKGSATTAVGLLSRMLLGWKRDHAGLERGVKFLVDEGPSASNMYYNYYAAQVMVHYGGPQARPWFDKMRRMLVDSQTQQGHERGSWYFRGGDHGASRGGRLYLTAMAAMNLEVPYRISRIYQNDAVDEDFPEE